MSEGHSHRQRADYLGASDRLGGHNSLEDEHSSRVRCGDGSARAPQFRTVFWARQVGQRCGAAMGTLWLLLRCVTALLRTRLDLYIAGYDHTLRMITAEQRNVESPMPVDEVLDLCRVVNGVGMRLGSKCLERSLAARRLLLLRGVDARLIIGVRRADGGEFMAHAWLEHNNVIVNDIAQVTRDFQTIHDPGVSVH